MELNIKFDNAKLKEPTEIICGKLGVELSDKGIPVEIHKSDKLTVSSNGEKGEIYYITKASFFRMMTLFVKNLKDKKAFNYSEEVQFETCGLWLDLSRNGIMRPDALKEYFSYMAMMGLNTVMIYIESGYKLDDYPYFGYMQGAYSKEELKAIDDAADMFGIEAFPGIQTLPHMEKYLRFSEAAPVRDTIRCMMPCAEESYKLIDTMLEHLSGCFRSNRIWLGLDEGWNVGRGDYFSLNRNSKELKMPAELVEEHTKKVVELAHKYNRNASLCPTTIRYHGLFDAMAEFEPFDDIVVAVGSYEGTLDEKEFVNILNSCGSLKNKKAIIGGIQTWYGFAPENNFSLGNAKAILPLCKKYGLDEVYGTIWMNDGAECDFFLSLLGAQAYAEHMYNADVSDEQIKDMFEFISGTDYNAFMDLSYFHSKNMLNDGLKEEDGQNFWGKKLLWSDPMLGLFDYKLYQSPMSEHYGKMKEKFAEYKISGNTFFAKRYEFFERIFDVLALKCRIAENLKPAYMKGDREFLGEVAYKLFPSLGEKVERLRKTHRELWLEVCKPFGQEIIDQRYGCLYARCESGAYRLSEYLDGKIEVLEELEEERLPKALIYGGMYFGQFSANHPCSGAI